MGKVTALLLERYKAGQLPLTVQSMDNCSHNGDKVPFRLRLPVGQAG